MSPRPPRSTGEAHGRIRPRRRRTLAARGTTLFKTGTYQVRRLSPEDTPRVRALAERCGDYLELHYGAPAQPHHLVHELLTELPPDKTLDDKFSLGLIEQEPRLAGALDVVRDYPEPREWYLGLLVLAPEQRGQGRGTDILLALAQWLREQGARGVRLAVSEHNEAGRRFWTRAGFLPVRQVMAGFGQRHSLFHVLRLPLERT